MVDQAPNSVLPKRFPTPSLDELYHQHLVPGAPPRFALLPAPGVGWFDRALAIYQDRVDWKGEPVDISGVKPEDAKTATEWEVHTQTVAIRACGWTLPSGNPNDPAYVFTAEEVARMTAPPLSPPVASMEPAAQTVPAQGGLPTLLPAAASTTAIQPPSAAQMVHQAHASSWLSKLGHIAGDVASYVTPENVAKVTALLEALAPLVRRAP